VSGGEAIQLTRDPADDSEPVFSADGSKLAFHSDRDGGGVYVMSALGGEARRIARQGRQPRFSPDGTQIAYSVGSVIYGKIYVVPSEGGQTRQIQPDFTTARNPIWCPDGKHLLFAGGQSGDGGDWWVAALDGVPAIQTGAVGVFQQHGLSLGLNTLAGSGFPELWLPGTDSVIFPTLSSGTSRRILTDSIRLAAVNSDEAAKSCSKSGIWDADGMKHLSPLGATPGYLAFFRFAAQYAFIRSPWALRRAALWRLRFGAGATGAADVAMAFGGLPRRFAEP
jgi:hypothetical protein